MAIDNIQIRQTLKLGCITTKPDRVATKILRRFSGRAADKVIHEFVTTFRVNDRPIYMALWS